MLLGSPLKNSEPLWDIFEISPFSDQNRVNSGVRGTPRNFIFLYLYFILLESSYLCYLEAHATIYNPMISLSGIYLKLAHFLVKIGLNGWYGGSPKLFPIGILLFMLLGGPLKIWEPYDKPFWDIFEISTFSNQYRVNSGGRRSPKKFYMIGIFLLMLLGSPCKHLECHDKPFWDIFEISPFSGPK